MVAFFSVYPFHTILCNPLNVSVSHLTVQSLSNFIGGRGGGIVKLRRNTCRFVALSTHSIPRILKSNRRSRYGHLLSPFDTDDEDFDDEDDEVKDDSSASNVSLLALCPVRGCFPCFWKYAFCFKWNLISQDLTALFGSSFRALGFANEIIKTRLSLFQTCSSRKC